MYFDDIGENPILWCAWCGPQAQEMDAAIQKAFKERPNFMEDFKNALDKHSPNGVLFPPATTQLSTATDDPERPDTQDRVSTI